MKQVDISVIICTYNRAEMLNRAIKSVIDQENSEKFTYEIIIIDDGSTDETKSVVTEISAKTKVPLRYFFNKGSGIAEARNLGIVEASGKWIAFTDDDQWVEKDWLHNLFTIVSRNSAYCVGGTIRLDLKREQLCNLGPVCRGLLGEFIPYKEATICRGKNIPSNGNLLIDRKIFDSVGAYNPALLAGGEDHDFIIRARSAGYDIWTAPGAIVYHSVPLYRLRRDYFRWVSLRRGSIYSQIDINNIGRRKILLLSIARTVQALLINIPNLIMGYIMRDKIKILDKKCLLWRAEGYLRNTLSLIGFYKISQKNYFNQLEFRKERENFIRDNNI